MYVKYLMLCLGKSIRKEFRVWFADHQKADLTEAKSWLLDRWLPLLHTLTRNDTLASLAAGKYRNIRSAKPLIIVSRDGVHR
eukprot:SAG11_NODE_17576_length_514_cov_1.219277_1_plen_82_part_00